MVNGAFDLFQQFLLRYGAAAVFGAGFLEEVVFIIPSSLVFLAAGFFLVDPGLPWGMAVLLIAVKVAFWGSLGVTFGSYVVYGFFYWGGRAAIDKYGKYFAVSWERIAALEKKFARGRADEWALFLLRATPIASMTLISAVSGFIRLPWKTFGVFTFLGTMARLFILGFLGWKFGAAYQAWAERLEVWERYSTLLLLAGAAIAAFWIYKKYLKHEKSAAD